MTEASQTGYEHALSMLRRVASPDGYLASVSERDNYRRVWGRDGVIIGLAGLVSGEKDLEEAMLATLRTLQTHQGPHGEIPSNVDAISGNVSYGGMAGRVDAGLWFIIGVAAYWRSTGDDKTIEEFAKSLEKIEFLLGAWEFNTRGLLYVPQTGDWSDEYVQQGYVLYDQALYYRALMDLREMRKALTGKDDQTLCDKTGRLRALIRANYWFVDCDLDEPDAYHPVLHKKGCQAADKINNHWMAFFSPTGYGYSFDAFANVLVSLFDLADNEQRKRVDAHIAGEVIKEEAMILPAFHPVINEDQDGWHQLQVAFSFNFKNKPYEFHNSGLWPFITGFYAMDLAKRGKTDLAKKYLEGIHAANKKDSGGGEWGFPEYLHGQTFEPKGTRYQGWSAAGAVIAEKALEGVYAL